MHIRKPTIRERAMYTEFARTYDQLFKNRCIRAINLTGLALSRHLNIEKPLDKLNLSFKALQAAAKMKGIDAVEKFVFSFNHRISAYDDLLRQIQLIHAKPLFEALANEELKV